jgi:hypothetical protein
LHRLLLADSTSGENFADILPVSEGVIGGSYYYKETKYIDRVHLNSRMVKRILGGRL